MTPLGAVIFYFEFIAWFTTICLVAGIAILPFNLLYSYITRSKS